MRYSQTLKHVPAFSTTTLVPPKLNRFVILLFLTSRGQVINDGC